MGEFESGPLESFDHEDRPKGLKPINVMTQGFLGFLAGRQ